MSKEALLDYMKKLKHIVQHNSPIAFDAYQKMKNSQKQLLDNLDMKYINSDRELSQATTEATSALRSYLNKEGYRHLAEQNSADLEAAVKRCEDETKITPDLDDIASKYNSHAYAKPTSLEDYVSVSKNAFGYLNSLRQYLISGGEKLDSSQYERIRKMATTIFTEDYFKDAIGSGQISKENMEDLIHRLKEHLLANYHRIKSEMKKEQADYVNSFHGHIRTPNNEDSLAAVLNKDLEKSIEEEYKKEVPVRKEGLFSRLKNKVTSYFNRGGYEAKTSDVVNNLYDTTSGKTPGSESLKNRSDLMMANINALPESGYTSKEITKLREVYNNMNRIRQALHGQNVPVDKGYQTSMNKLYGIISNNSAPNEQQRPAYARVS